MCGVAILVEVILTHEIGRIAGLHGVTLFYKYMNKYNLYKMQK